jgi:RHS repeat-associated protein
VVLSQWVVLREYRSCNDLETDLFENWNRFYDPSIGRYLGPEPLLQDPKWVLKEAKVGRSVPVYAYANNNPIFFTDPDGKNVFALVERIAHGIKVVKNLKRAEALRKVGQGADVAAASGKDAKKLAKDVSKANGGGGGASSAEQHVIDKGTGELGVRHYHALDDKGKHLPGAGHVFVLESLKAFGAAVLDVNGNGKLLDPQDMGQLANDLLNPLPSSSSPSPGGPEGLYVDPNML